MCLKIFKNNFFIKRKKRSTVTTRTTQRFGKFSVVRILAKVQNCKQWTQTMEVEEVENAARESGGKAMDETA